MCWTDNGKKLPETLDREVVAVRHTNSDNEATLLIYKNWCILKRRV